MSTLLTGLCALCRQPFGDLPSRLQILPEGKDWCHDQCYEFFKESRPEPLREAGFELDDGWRKRDDPVVDVPELPSGTTVNDPAPVLEVQEDDEAMLNHRKVVYVAHPLGGAVEENIQKVLGILRKIHTGTVIPVAPYIACCQYLRDGLEEERLLGIDANFEYFHRKFIDELWLYGDTISPGMVEEIVLARSLEIPVIPKTLATQQHMLDLANANHRDRDSR